MAKPKAVVLLSGGLDSAVTLGVALRDGYDVTALTFEYGQRHAKEVQAAHRLAAALGVKDHRVIRLDLGSIGGSALTDRAIEVPRDRKVETMGESIPATYVPARNTILLAYGLAVAEVCGGSALYIGAHSEDYSGYPDCRPEFFAAFRQLALLATKAGVEGHPLEIRTPLLRLGKADIIRLGRELNTPFGFTWSCYLGGEKPCGRCDSCILRKRGFDAVGIPDPAEAT